MSAAAGGLGVCHVIDGLRFGGAEKQFINTLNALTGVRKYALLLRDFDPVPELRDAIDDDVTVLSLRLRLRYAPLYVVRIARWLRENRIDVVHTHMFWPNLYGLLAARLAGVPVAVTTDHGTDPWKRSIHWWLERNTISRLADARCCVSKNVFHVLQEAVGERGPGFRLVSNGTVIPEATPPTERRPLHIGSVGRLVWEKDYVSLVAAAALLRERGVDFRLTILGDGPQRGLLEAAVRDNRLGDRVALPGFSDDVGGFLRGIDVFVLPSVEEGQPLALLEAMAYGLPLVATRIGGIPDTVSDGSEGILVEAGRPEPLAAALALLCGDVERRRALGQAARQRAVRDFSVQAQAQQYALLYRELWERKCRPVTTAAPMRLIRKRD